MPFPVVPARIWTCRQRRRRSGAPAARPLPRSVNFRLRTKAMKLPRRKFLHLAAGAAAVPIASRIASGQTYPTRPVRFIVPYPPGGATDVAARVIGEYLSRSLGQQIVVEN